MHGFNKIACRIISLLCTIGIRLVHCKQYFVCIILFFFKPQTVACGDGTVDQQYFAHSI